MMRSLTTAATGMVAQQYNLDTIANNLANVNTTAFKQQRAEFQDLMYQTFRTAGSGAGAPPSAQQLGLGSRFASTSGNFATGPAQATGNPLDVMISGEGFFQITLLDGTAAFTRDGSFRRNADGNLVTADGYALEPAITIPAEATNISITNNGELTYMVPGQTEPERLQIQVATFANPAGLTRVGQNLYAVSAASGEPVQASPGQEGAGTLISGFLEGSNVQVVEEMTRMILAQRAYEINSKAIQTADDMLGVLNTLKR